jgi:hypothetical protein
MFDPAGFGLGYDPPPMATRYRCSACGNLTRFDVVVQRRTREFHHFSVAGDLTIEDEEKLAETIERVTCRWCAASGDAIESIPAAVDGPQSDPSVPAGPTPAAG